MALVRLCGGPPVSPWQGARLRPVADGEYWARFALSLAIKDVRLALQAAGDDGLAVLGSLPDEWQQAVDQGLGREDLAVVPRVISSSQDRGRDLNKLRRLSPQRLCGMLREAPG